MASFKNKNKRFTEFSENQQLIKKFNLKEYFV